MTGAPSLRCSECGHEAGSERALHTTRRKWGLAIALLAILIGGTLSFRVRITNEGLAPLTPTAILLRALAWTDQSAGPPGDIQRELMSRISFAGPDSSLINSVAERILAGDSSAPLASEAWEQRYARLAMTIHHRAVNAIDERDPALRAAERFRALPPRPSVLAVRSTGPDGPLLLDLVIAEWWPPTTEAEVTITDRFDGRAHRLRLDAAAGSRTAPLEFAHARCDESTRTFDVRVQWRSTRRGASDEYGDEPPWSDSTTTPLLVDVANLGQVPALEPVDTPEMSKAIEEVFADGVLRWESGPYPVAFRMDAARAGINEFAGVLVGLEVSLHEGDALRRRIHVWFPAGPKGGGVRSEVVAEDLSALRRFAAAEAGPVAGWTVTVRGVSTIAARAHVPSIDPDTAARPAFARFWAGTRVIPAIATPMSGESPRRRWRKLSPVESPLEPSPSVETPSGADRDDRRKGLAP